MAAGPSINKPVSATIVMLAALDKLLFSCRINNATAGPTALPRAVPVYGGHFHMQYERSNRVIRIICTLALLSSTALAACTPATPPGATAGADYSEHMTAKVTGVTIPVDAGHLILTGINPTPVK